MTALSTFSSSVVWETLAHGGGRLPWSRGSSVVLPTDGFDQLASNISARIERSAVRVARRSQQTVDLLSGVDLYERVDEPEYRSAAEVAELFRDGKVGANAGHLDVRTLQGNILRAIREGDGLVFELGWGQAKRPVGGLKAEGPDADFAEVVAIARLATITRATQLLLDQPVMLRIVPGGRRFYEALFTRPEADRAYNEQRAAITAHFGHADMITIAKDEFDDTEDLLRARLTTTEVVSQPRPSLSELRFVQFGIDWEHVLELPEAPHGLSPPGGLSSVWPTLCRTDRDLLLRQLATAVVLPGVSGEPCGHLIDEQTFASSVDWMATVSWESAVKYSLLGKITRRDVGPRSWNPRVCRLTVIEKKGQPDVPVLTLLGSRHGNFLPQNVVGIVRGDRAEVRFAPRMSVPEHYTLVRTCVSGTGSQPLFFTDLSWEAATKVLQKTDIVSMT